MKELIPLARKLGKNLTDAEKYLWYILQRENLGVRFRKQSPIGNYIVDFVCFDKKLIIELDGGQHFDSKTDIVRDIWLKTQGFTILRFWNNQVLQNRNAVVEEIMKYLK